MDYSMKRSSTASVSPIARLASMRKAHWVPWLRAEVLSEVLFMDQQTEAGWSPIQNRAHLEI